MKERKFQAFIKFLGWWCISFGIHIDIRAPHLELHFPFGFARLGWQYYDPSEHPKFEDNNLGIF